MLEYFVVMQSAVLRIFLLMIVYATIGAAAVKCGADWYLHFWKPLPKNVFDG